MIGLFGKYYQLYKGENDALIFFIIPIRRITIYIYCNTILSLWYYTTHLI